jgi:receptor protein-tyrosine kinase
MAWILRRTEARRKHRKAEVENYDERLLTILDPDSVTAEGYRTLRTNLLHAAVGNPAKVIVITSFAGGEGKSMTCANLAVALAQVGKYTLALDCDFRKPQLHRYFGLRNLQGTVDLVAGERSLQEVAEEPLEGLKVVSVGPIPPNPADLLDSERFAKFLTDMREVFDYVLIDTPPLAMFSDPVILAAQSDGVLLVIDAQNTRKVSVGQCMRSLQTVGANVLGTVMNNVEASGSDAYGSDAYYSAGYRY